MPQIISNIFRQGSTVTAEWLEWRRVHGKLAGGREQEGGVSMNSEGIDSFVFTWVYVREEAAKHGQCL